MAETGLPSGCAALNERGEPCGMPRLATEEFCYIHSPTRAGQRARSRRKGAKARGRTFSAVAAEVSDADASLTLDDLASVRALLARAARDTLKQKNSSNRSRTLAQIASVAIAALRADRDEQIAEVWRAIDELTQGRPDLRRAAGLRRV